MRTSRLFPLMLSSELQAHVSSSARRRVALPRQPLEALPRSPLLLNLLAWWVCSCLYSDAQGPAVKSSSIEVQTPQAKPRISSDNDYHHSVAHRASVDLIYPSMRIKAMRWCCSRRRGTVKRQVGTRRSISCPTFPAAISLKAATVGLSFDSIFGACPCASIRARYVAASVSSKRLGILFKQSSTVILAMMIQR